MEKFFSLVLMLMLVSVWCDDSQFVHNDAESLRQLLELLRSVSQADRQPVEDTGLEISPDELMTDTESVEKRSSLPRLGVSIHRPLTSRVQSSKSMDASKYHFFYPAERMARLQA